MSDKKIELYWFEQCPLCKYSSFYDLEYSFWLCTKFDEECGLQNLTGNCDYYIKAKK